MLLAFTLLSEFSQLITCHWSSVPYFSSAWQCFLVLKKMGLTDSHHNLDLPKVGTGTLLGVFKVASQFCHCYRPLPLLRKSNRTMQYFSRRANHLWLYCSFTLSHQWMLRASLLRTGCIPVLHGLTVIWKLFTSGALSSEIEAKRDQIFRLGVEVHICLNTCIAILLLHSCPCFCSVFH